jgi:hypothetical protein
LEVDDEACPGIGPLEGINEKTPQIMRSKIGPKIPPKITKMKNIIAQDRR